MLAQIDIDQIPVELRERDQWIAWQDRDGRKVPINARTSQPAKSNDPDTWADLETALSALQINGSLSGLGFCFSPDDGMVGIDFDECVDNRGRIAEWALKWIASFDTYCEISPSGRGLKLWCFGQIERGRKKIIEEREGKSPGIEAYSSGRYFTVTGQRWEGLADSTVKSCQPQIDRLWKEHFSEPEPPKPQPNTGSGPQPSLGQMTVAERAVRYLARVPPAISGQHGHDRTFHAACVLILGFAMTIDEAWPVIADWNQSCEPPWNEQELRRKLDEANKQGGQRGWLLTGGQYQGSDVELRNLLASLDSDDSPPAAVPADPLAFPSDCLRPPGFLGELIDYNLATAIYPLPELALAGHLALLATLTGQKIEDSLFGTRTNAYICGLGPSRGGKDHARRVNQKLLHYAGLENYEGEENFASSASIYSALEANPVSLYQIDEIANLLATTHDAKRSPHLFKIADVFLRLWASSKGTLKADAYADRKKNKVLKYPHCVIYGTSVPGKFWQSITSENITDGLLGRFLIFEVPDANNGYVDAQKPQQIKLPESLTQTARAWSELRTHDGNLSEVDGAHVLSMQHTENAEARYWQHMQDVNERSKDEAPDTAAVWRGTPEKTSKLALLFAASRATADMLEAGKLPQIELQDVNRAIAVSNWVTRKMLRQANLWVAENDWDKSVKDAYRRLPIGEELTWSAFVRKTQKLKPRDRQQVVQTLVEAGYIETRTEASDNGRQVVYIKRRG